MIDICIRCGAPIEDEDPSYEAEMYILELEADGIKYQIEDQVCINCANYYNRMARKAKHMQERRSVNQAQDTTRYLIEQLMHEHGIDNREGHFQEAARQCADLIANGSTVAQALDTLPEDTIEQRYIAEHMRTFLYAIRLRMLVIASTGTGGLSQEEADDLHEHLRGKI